MRLQDESGPGTMWDIPYGPEPAQRLDLFLPSASAEGPFVLFVHGGGWSVGDKEQYEAVGACLAQQGVTAAIINYRLSPPARHPAHVEDVARAIAWCQRDAPRYGANLDDFCLMGHSSGAHLAALVALDPTYLAAEGLRSSLVRRIVGIAGVGYDLDETYATPMLRPFFEPVFGGDCTRWDQAAPLRYVTSSAPPCLLIHGLADTEAPASSSQRFAAELQAVGVPAELELIPEAGHVSVMFAAVPFVLDFLLGARPTPAPAGEALQ